MCLMKWIEKGMKKMKWYDVSCVKVAVFCMTLFLVTVWPWFARIVLGVAWYWWLAAGIIFMLPPLKKMFFK